MGFGLLPKKCIKKAELEDLLGPSSSRDGPPLWPLLPCELPQVGMSGTWPWLTS